ncbi:MAG: D-alanine--D-alanine ligase [Bacteroidetes bacterium]|nr:D-alanine--D-alanine ligase [Bacteroidota bacterium]
MASRIRVGVVFGGRSSEHQVSLVSAASVMRALPPEKYEVVPIGITPDGRWISSGSALSLLKEGRVPADEPEHTLLPEPGRHGLIGAAGGGNADTIRLDVIFPVLHGTFGEDGTLQGLLELADIPYVGAGVLGSAVGMDKIVQKQLFEQAKIPVPRYCWFYSEAVTGAPRAAASTVERRLRYPVFVKPANTGSSVGISKAHDRKELLRSFAEATEYDRKVIVEQGIRDAREIEVSVLGNDQPEASVPGEIIPSNEFYDYDAKYVDGASTAVIPAKIPTSAARTVRAYAVRAYRAIDCAGMARADFLMARRTGRLYINELNTIPGFTAISMYPKLWEASGLAYPALLDRLIQLAMDRYRQTRALRRMYNPSRAWYQS